MFGEKRGTKIMFFSLLDVFLTCKTCLGEISLAYVSWPNLNSHKVAIKRDIRAKGNFSFDWNCI